jgi:uncharacterized protein YjbJ (UPF0337 family)
MPQIVHLSVKYSKPERMETTLWTVGRDRHFGQRGGPLGAVDAGSDITAYSLDWKGQFVSWHLVPSKELLVSINDARNADLCPQQPADGIKRRLRNPSALCGVARFSHPEDCAMDWNRVEGNWKEVKGKVKEKWGKLTDDDLTAINGQRDQLEGRLQERYGYAKDQARKDVDTWFSTLK